MLKCCCHVPLQHTLKQSNAHVAHYLWWLLILMLGDYNVWYIVVASSVGRTIKKTRTSLSQHRKYKSKEWDPTVYKSVCPTLKDPSQETTWRGCICFCNECQWSNKPLSHPPPVLLCGYFRLNPVCQLLFHNRWHRLGLKRRSWQVWKSHIRGPWREPQDVTDENDQERCMWVQDCSPVRMLRLQHRYEAQTAD